MSTWPCIMTSRLMSFMFMMMTLNHVTQPIILRPDWFPYFGDRQGQPQPVNHSRLHASQQAELTGHGGHLTGHLGGHELGGHQLDPQSRGDLERAMASARAFNCTASHNETLPGCYLYHTSLLLRLLHSQFHKALQQ